jgi:hypothetical protein
LLAKIPEVHILASSENIQYSLFFFSSQTLLRQLHRDQNVRTLLNAIRDAFEFSKEAAVLRNIQPESKQEKILDEMLQVVSASAVFIESYAKDVQLSKSRLGPSRFLLSTREFFLGTRALKNITGQVDGKVEQYRTTLARLRQEFLAHATVTTEVAVLKMRKDVKKVNTQLTEMSSHTLEAGA